jgi:hypothetical protein
MLETTRAVAWRQGKSETTPCSAMRRVQASTSPRPRGVRGLIMWAPGAGPAGRRETVRPGRLGTLPPEPPPRGGSSACPPCSPRMRRDAVRRTAGIQPAAVLAADLTRSLFRTTGFALRLACWRRASPTGFIVYFGPKKPPPGASPSVISIQYIRPERRQVRRPCADRWAVPSLLRHLGCSSCGLLGVSFFPFPLN